MFHDRKIIGDKYVRHAGYNEVGELNDIIIIYPQATPTPVNPQGCWDWWGYTGAMYGKDILTLPSNLNMDCAFLRIGEFHYVVLGIEVGNNDSNFTIKMFCILLVKIITKRKTYQQLVIPILIVFLIKYVHSLTFLNM